MIKLIFAFILIILLGAKDLPQPKQEKLIRMNSVRPTHILDYIDTMAARYNIPKEVIWGIGWNESHWGQSPLAKRSNNLFGIKCGDGWNGKRCGTYRAYGSHFESVEDFCCYIHKYYSHLIGKPLGRWYIKGYAAKPYKF